MVRPTLRSPGEGAAGVGNEPRTAPFLGSTRTIWFDSGSRTQTIGPAIAGEANAAISATVGRMTDPLFIGIFSSVRAGALEPANAAEEQVHGQLPAPEAASKDTRASRACRQRSGWGRLISAESAICNDALGGAAMACKGCGYATDWRSWKQEDVVIEGDGV